MPTAYLTLATGRLSFLTIRLGRHGRALPFRTTSGLYRHVGVHSRHAIDLKLAMGLCTRCGYGCHIRAANDPGGSYPSNELDDYADYARRVKYKLVPAIW
jgi:hypothetical protein